MFISTAIGVLIFLLIPLSLQQEGDGPHQLRNVTNFDLNWLFHYGDASGASSADFADSTWRSLSVPHDWAIEGSNPPANPFSSQAPSLGLGGFVSSGISWYRKHFSLDGTPSDRKVYIEFDGVMQDASIYINGKLIGFHPYGYTSFRYDITSAVDLKGDNVVAVKTDTSVQPGERFYKGAGIYRNVRLIITDPVHVEQYGTYVSTPTVSGSSAVIRGQITVVNDGDKGANVSVRGVLTGPDNSALPAVVAPAQSIPAGARASFTINVTVSNPKLWDIDSPNLYSFVPTVSVDGTPVDNDSTTVGIRSIVFDASKGMSLNGKTIKFQGVCLHQDYHGLGMAAPKRAMQRRLTQLKALGVNSIRTAHDPPSPAFLDLTDRMGFLVMDEFFDVWAGRKYSDVGDYSMHFNQLASEPTGTPPVPGATGQIPWYQVDVTSIVSRDRNHPSIALYSVGNEIRDSLTIRTPLLKRMKEIVNALDPGRPITQALLRPSDSGDITGSTRTIVDIFGANYREKEVLEGMKASPPRAGVLTEETTPIDQWNSVRDNAGLTGLFLWTGVDHLGESQTWPTVGASPGLLDSVGGIKTIGYAWQKVWGAPVTSQPATGTSASKITLTPEQNTVSTSNDDILYIKASVVDSAGILVTSSSAGITFSISGPGVIVAVDSGNQQAESFRGSVRNAYQGVAYVLVRATGEGVITVSASASGLTSGSAVVTGTLGGFAL